MMADNQIDRMLGKLIRLENSLDDLIFIPVDQIKMQWYKTAERLHDIPCGALFSDCKIGDVWGGAGNYCWFFGTYKPKQELQGKRLYLYPKTTGYEAMLWTDGVPTGIFAEKYSARSHGNHYCDMLVNQADPEKTIEIAIEYYAGNFCIGSKPLENEETRDFNYSVGSLDVCIKDEFYAEFLFDLKILNQMAAVLDKNNFRRADIIRTLLKVHERILYSPEDTDEESFRNALKEAHPYIKEALAKRNSVSAPIAGIIGHSHMDTAWLWVIDETIKKCARTYANQISLMEQYPEYLFIQSSSYHTEVVRRHYPELFERIAAAVSNGRYEPNGGVWVECDCNIPSGELMARQFIWGQRYTKKHFGYTSDTFWLPDTFGYSAAIPQIMKLSGIRYFLTTKMDWNDTNQFPYDSFWWRGIDGSEVLAHFNRSHVWPDPKSLVEYVVEGREARDSIREKNVTGRRLLAFGYGDGGGGPQFEMLEAARRVADVEGLPRSSYTTVSQFMQDLEGDLTDPSVYSGELYLELHRGTLTNQHDIKRNNRLAEIALHNLEYLAVRNAMDNGIHASSESIHPLTERLLVNQFHDILPGTCIPEVHEQSLRETKAMIQTTDQMSRSIVDSDDNDYITITNTTTFQRNDVVYIPNPNGRYLDCNLKQQLIETVEGELKLAVSGIELSPYSSKSYQWSEDWGIEESIHKFDRPFILDGNHLETPFAVIEFDSCGYIRSLKDKQCGGRELCDNGGYSLNTFLLAEDVPSAWDNWDIDADLEYKFRPIHTLISREIITNGCIELRIRSSYQLTDKSTLAQDMIFYADSPMIRFETLMNWQDNHRFLKASFDTAIHSNEARHEIQFGYVKRPTTRNNDIEKAMFEVCAHKYTDLSEMRYGFSIMNDCKYGISMKNSSARLSLHKGGTRPDYKGDHGEHYCVYAILPHNGGFSTDAVIKPAYLLNYRHFISDGRREQDSLLTIDSDHIIAETIKPCEDEQKAFILRFYECEGASSTAEITIPNATKIIAVDLLEEPVGPETAGNKIHLAFRPFEIHTIKVHY